MNYLIAIRKVILAEGRDKYTNDPDDSGGPTKYGVTLKTLSEFRKRKCTADDVKNLTESEAIQIYKVLFWDKVKGDQISSFNIAYTLFNFAVNSGVGTSVSLAQKVLGLTRDSVIGSKTVSAINATNDQTFLSNFLAEAKIYYQDLAARREKDKKFLKGWLNRVDHIADFVGVKPAVIVGGSALLVVGLFFLTYLLSSRPKKA